MPFEHSVDTGAAWAFAGRSELATTSIAIVIGVAACPIFAVPTFVVVPGTD